MPEQFETSTLEVIKEDVLALLTNMVIFILGCWTRDLFHREVFFVRRMVFLLLFAWTSYVVHPPIAHAVLFALTFWLVILLSEVIVNETREFKSRWSSAGIKIGQFINQYWNVAAILRPSAFECDVQYHPATICDTSVPDDPFWPNHISTIFVVEWRRRNLIWTTITIWQVSLLNGGKKIVHQFDQFWQWTDGRPFKYGCTRAENVDCYQSHDVIFILIRRFKDRADDFAKLFVYDARFKKFAAYDMKLPDHPNIYAFSVTCIGRLIGSNGSLEGWRIRMLSAAVLVVDDLPACRAHVINEIYELRQEAFLVRSEDIAFGQMSEAPPKVRPVRTSIGHFGLHAVGSMRSAVMLFIEATSEYAIFRSFNDLILMDNRLATYIYSFPDRPSLPMYGRFPSRYVWPLFWNDREAIMATGSCIVSRTTFRCSSLKYLAAKLLFQSNPQLRTRLNAEHFRQTTGIGGMDGHFG